VLNQLLGAQQPDGAAWGFYVQMEGTKSYSATLEANCCLSSGPRGIALLPTFAITTDEDGAVINLFDAAAAHLTLRDGTPVTLKLETHYPADGHIRVIVEPATQSVFSVKLRLPTWCKEYSISPSNVVRGDDGYTALRRSWKSGDTIDLKLKLEPRLVVGDHLNRGKAALLYGPLVLAADESLLADADRPLDSVAIPKPDLAALSVTPEAAPDDRKTWPGAQCFQVNATSRQGGTPFTTRLVPFADAGIIGTRYKVWLPLAGHPDANVLLDGVENRSRQGNIEGSIIDDDFQTLVVTYDGQRATEDWYGVTLAQPATARRVIFAHGKLFHDGGWFDTSAGKPRVQIQRTAGSAWETVGELEDYPSTTATDGQHDRLIWGNRRFTLKLTNPVTFISIRVIGVPASGDNPQQSFSSCAELQAYSE
jgi:hypothetical protein